MPSHIPLEKWAFLPIIWNVFFRTRNNYSSSHWFNAFSLEIYQLVLPPPLLRDHMPARFCLVQLLFQEHHQYFPSTLMMPWKQDLLRKARSVLLAEESTNTAGSLQHLFGLLRCLTSLIPGQWALLRCSDSASCKLLKSPSCILASRIVPWNKESVLGT